MSKRNITAVVLGLLLFVGGTAGFLVFAQFINPPTTEVVVAVVDIPVGTTLTEEMLAVDNVHVNPKVLSSLVRKSELDQFLGSTVVEPVSQYEFLRKATLAAEGNPASAQRVALALSDPNLVAMVVPVMPETAPPSILEGDYVDLSFGVPSNASFGSSMDVAPTPNALTGQFFQPFESTPVSLEPSLQSTPTPELLLLMPVAKTIVSNAKVLALIHEEKAVPTSNLSDSSRNDQRTVIVKGKLLGLVVAIPREAQELLQFAIDNGVVRVSVLSAAAQPGDTHQPTLGMTWNDLVALMKMDREAALANGLPEDVIGPGAAAIEATREPVAPEVGGSNTGFTTNGAGPTAQPTPQP